MLQKQYALHWSFPGLIDAAIFTDFNNDKKPDLIIGGEWTTIRFFKNENNKLVEDNSAKRVLKI